MCKLNLECSDQVIIDTDCGSDDAIALCMALLNENSNIKCISVVAGNVELEQACQNTLSCIEAIARHKKLSKQQTHEELPKVYKGAPSMLVRDLICAYETHGNDGLGDKDYRPLYLKAELKPAVFELYDHLVQSPDKSIDLICLGPLTNIALLAKISPEALLRARRIVIMGSAGLGRGNVTPCAEFNIWQDAEAARIVLELGHPQLIFVGWDACLGEALLNEEDIKRLEQSSPLGAWLVDVNSQLIELNKERFGKLSLDLADPACMAAALNPACIKKIDHLYAQIDCSVGPSYGSVLFDVDACLQREANAWLISELDAKVYKDYLVELLSDTASI